MKRLLIIITIMLSTMMTAQAPQKMSYQAVIRDAANSLIANTNVGIRVSILQGSSTGTAVYQETHTVTTNINGLVSLEVGAGTVISGTFSSIAWSSGDFYIKTETDPTGGSSYTISGTSQLLSVPYALYAGSSGRESSTSWTVSGNDQYASTTGNVGVGTSTPTEKLEVSGKTKTTNLQVTNGATNGYVLQCDASGNGTWVNPTSLSLTESDPKVQSSISNSIPKWDGTSLVNGSIYDKSSNIVIGASDASFGTDLIFPKLSVVSENINNIDLNVINFSDSSISPWLNWGKARGSINTKAAVQNGDQLFLLNINGYDGSNFKSSVQIEATVDGAVATNSIPSKLTFSTTAVGSTSRVERMRITNAGNIGIGTTSPSEKLEVSGKTKTTNLQVTTGATNGYVLQSDASGNGTWVNPTTLNNGNWTTSGTNQYNALIGNVGIGNSSPSEKLEVSGKTKTTNLQVTTGATNGYVLQSDASGNGTWVNPTTIFNNSWTTSGTNQYSNLTGNVGIGTTSPQAKLHIVATNSSESTDQSSTTTITNTIYSSGNGSSIYQTFKCGVTGNLSSLQLYFSSGSGATRTISIYEGSGISGTLLGTSTTTIPSIVNSFGIATITFNDVFLTKDSTYTILVNNLDYLARSNFNIYNDGQNSISASSDLLFITYIKSGNFFSVNNNGIGVGVIAPSEALEVSGKTKTTTFQMTTSPINGYVLQSDASGNGTWVNPTTLSSGNWTTNGANQYSALSGNVGIGISNPTNKLEVNGTTKTTNLQVTNGATNGYVLQSDASGNGTWVNPTTLSNGNWTTSGTNQYSTLSGNVGIGTTSPTEKLEISGKTKTTNFQLTNGAVNGYLLQSDASGNASWIAQSNLSPKIITDADNNTKIQVEETSNENIIRFDINGTEKWRMTDNRLEAVNTGNSLFIGFEAGKNDDISSNHNVALGYGALTSNIVGGSNVAIGSQSLYNNTANNNIAIGRQALYHNTTGYGNVSNGFNALLNNTTGYENVAIGFGTSYNNVSGNRNVCLGYYAGFANSTGSGNVFLGSHAGQNETGSNKLYIESSNTSTPLIYGEFDNDLVKVNGEVRVNGALSTKFKTPLVAGTTNPDATGMTWRYTSGTGTITLPAASTCPDRIYVIINQTGSTRTISSYRDLVTNTQTTLGSSEALWIQSDGSEWWQIK